MEGRLVATARAVLGQYLGEQSARRLARVDGSQEQVATEGERESQLRTILAAQDLYERRVLWAMSPPRSCPPKRGHGSARVVVRDIEVVHTIRKHYVRLGTLGLQSNGSVPARPDPAVRSQNKIHFV